MEYDLITVAETEPFQRKAGRLLADNDPQAVIRVVANR
jgi:hypothetical protein